MTLTVPISLLVSYLDQLSFSTFRAGFGPIQAAPARFSGGPDAAATVVSSRSGRG